MDLLIPMGVNAVLGLVLLALFYWKLGGDRVRVASADEALAVFRQHFPDAAGEATLGADGRSALIESRGRFGLLQRHGRRWNARMLAPRELSHVRLDEKGAIDLSFADFGWPRAHIALVDADARAKWVANLESLMDVRRA